MKKITYAFALLTVLLWALVGCNNKDTFFTGTDNSLNTFSITANGVTYLAAIVGDKIVLSVPMGVDLSSAEVQYELCEHATIIPDPKTIKDWNSQHVFRVKSYSQIPREYTYSVQRTDVSQSGNVQLLTQTEVNNFAKLGITTIDGNLIIGSDSKPVQDSIVNIEALASIKGVRYNIVINRSFTGGTLVGLENIEHCGGIQIGTNTSPIEFPAVSGLSIDMPKLKSVGDIILNSSSIKSVAFTKLESVTSLFISSNSLVALKLPLLKETVNGLSLSNTSASINSILPEISLPALEKVGGKLSLQYFSGVNAVNFPILQSVGGDIDIALNAGTLEELTFPALETVNGSVLMERAPGLLKLSIPKVKQVKAFTYNKTSYGSYPLESLDLSSLEVVTGEFYIRGVAAMESFVLPNLKQVGTELTIWDLKGATTVKLPAIKEIQKRLQLYSVSSLKSLDISTLETLGRLDLTGCVELAKVQSPVEITNITINYASNAACVTPEFEGLKKVKGELSFTNDYNTLNYEVKHIEYIGTLKFGGGKTNSVLNLFDVKKIQSFELSSSNLAELNAPKLTEIENMKFTYISNLATIKIPELKTVGAFTLSEHNQWNTSNARMTNLNAFSSIISIGSVDISYCNKLVDFRGLSEIISGLDAEKWSVKNCGYNPTYQNMVDGQYVKP